MLTFWCFPQIPQDCRPLASPTTLVASSAQCVTSVWMAFPSPWTWITTSTALETTTRESHLLKKQCGQHHGLPSSLSCLPLPLWSWTFFLFLSSCFLCSWGRDSSDFGDRNRKMGLLIFWWDTSGKNLEVVSITIMFPEYVSIFVPIHGPGDGSQ